MQLGACGGSFGFFAFKLTTYDVNLSQRSQERSSRSANITWINCRLAITRLTDVSEIAQKYVL